MSCHTDPWSQLADPARSLAELFGLAHQPNMVIDTDCITLRAATDWIIGRVAGLRVTALGPGTVHVHPVVVHVSHSLAKIDVHTGRAGCGYIPEQNSRLKSTFNSFFIFLKTGEFFV